MTFLIFFISLVVIICFHELGHYLMARYFNTAISQFSIGIGGPCLTKTNQRGTLWRISPWLLGGYVEMPPKSMQAPEVKGVPFESLNRLKRALIIASGPFMNIVLAFGLLYITFLLGIEQAKPIIGTVSENSIAQASALEANDRIMLINHVRTPTWPSAAQVIMRQLGEKSTLTMIIERQGELLQRNMILDQWQLDPLQPRLLQSLGITPKRPPIPPIIDKVDNGSAADRGGLQSGDHITAFNHLAITDWTELKEAIENNPGETVTLRIKRGETYHTTTLTLDQKGWLKIQGSLGIRVAPIQQDPNLMTAVNYLDENNAIIASKHLASLTTFQADMLSKILTGKLSIQSLGGPATLYQYASISLTQGIAQFCYFLALLNIMLALVNMIPLPVLDGGQLLLLLVETIRGKPLSDALSQLLNRIGMICIVILMMQAIINDFLRAVAS